MLLGVLTALWQRPRISEHVLRHYAAMRVRGVRFVLVGVRSPEDPSPCPHVPGWEYAHAPNAPLSNKWNVGMRALRSRVDAVMIVGSDDLVAAAYVSAAADALRAGADLVRTDRAVFYEATTGRAAGGRMPRMGAARVLSAPCLELLGWRPWPAGLSRCLDAGQDHRLHAAKPHGVREVRLRDVPPIVDVKSETNIWSYDEMRRHAPHALTPDDLRTLFQTHYPTALPLLDMAKKTAKKTAAAKKEATTTTKPPAGLSGPVDPTPRTVRSGTMSAKVLAEREAGAAATAEADASKTGTVRLKALKNVPGDLAGTERRQYRGRIWDAPARLAGHLTRNGLAEEV